MEAIKIIKITIGLIFVGLYISITQATSPSCASIADKGLQNNHIYIDNMVKNFCDASYIKKCMGSDTDLDYFDANQSVFLSILCDNVNMGNNYKSIIRDGDHSMLKNKSFYGLGIIEANSDGGSCYYQNNTMNSCDLEKHLPIIFNKIINDYFNIAHARIYGIKSMDDPFRSKDIANEFSSHHFVGLNICDDNNQSHKNTCKYLKNYIVKARNLLNNMEILNVKNIAKQKIDCRNESSKNILYCGLFADMDYELHFNNLIYNEYLRYSLFMTYYANNLGNNAKLSSLSEGNDLDKLSKNREKIYQIQKQIYNIKNGLDLSFRKLSEISGAFPVHIGMTMYQEDANLFMKEIAKIYAPIRTLYDKLRNVQEK